jgi:hypothetical protein
MGGDDMKLKIRYDNKILYKPITKYFIEWYIRLKKEGHNIELLNKEDIIPCLQVMALIKFALIASGFPEKEIEHLGLRI